MAQPSSLFVGRDILQTILGTLLLGHPVYVGVSLKNQEILKLPSEF